MASAVPLQGDVVALLEKTGKVLVIHLVSKESRGLGSIDSEGNKPLKLGASLRSQAKPSMSCLRFDPLKPRLLAVDTEGKIIITKFKRSSCQMELQ